MIQMSETQVLVISPSSNKHLKTQRSTKFSSPTAGDVRESCKNIVNMHLVFKINLYCRELRWRDKCLVGIRRKATTEIMNFVVACKKTLVFWYRSNGHLSNIHCF